MCVATQYSDEVMVYSPSRMAYLHCRTRTRIPIRVWIFVPKMGTGIQIQIRICAMRTVSVQYNVTIRFGIRDGNQVRELVCLRWPRPRPRLRQKSRPMEVGSMIMFGSVYTEPGPRPMQISIGSVHILSLSGIVNEPLCKVNKS